MAIIKCKMCGGDLNIIEGQSVCECEYCGTRQTVPMIDDEKKMNLFARANRLRFNSEFDKASGIYESIIADASEEAEAYWGLVLCKYGIEYVDDPTTGKKIPTCHRSSFDSVMQDSDFDLACEYADPIARKVYRQEAKQIEEIRKGILEVSSKEEPYDIFICYKETGENGDRTLDSVLAQDIYDALTDKGYRTFFARISLEDKLGQEYEPYIFAALNSAKIMLAVGTDYDYYNAVWVKNEWSRYLKLMVKDKEKHLIPCYKNLDAYDIPQEFAKLQAQDLGKVGAIQDLLRGIEKLLGGIAVQETKSEQTVVVKAEVLGVKSLLKRADMFLEDKEWESAKEYYNRVLDIDPECAEAYLGLNLAGYRYVSMHQAAEKRKEDFFASKHFKKAEHFAKGNLESRISAARNLLEKRLAEYEEEKKLAAIEYAHQSVEKVNALTPIREKMGAIEDYFVGTGDGFVVGLRSDGTVLSAGKDRDGFQNVLNLTEVVAISVGTRHMVGLKSDGTVAAVGSQYDGRCNVSDWTDIIAVSAGFNHTVGLRCDGTVVAVGDNEEDQCEVSDWTDIVAVSAGFYHTVGLRSDGTVVAVGKNDSHQCDVSHWTDIIAINVGYSYTIGLRIDGRVLTTESYISHRCNAWTDIVAISTSDWHAAGLRSDGTVVAAGNNSNHQYDVSNWTDIVAISTSCGQTAGLRSDGTVVTTDSSISLNWTDIVAICAGYDSSTKDNYIVGIHSDGTVVTKRGNTKKSCQFDVSQWKLFDSLEAAGQRKNAVLEWRKTKECQARERVSQFPAMRQKLKPVTGRFISAGGSHIVGLQSDGTVVAAGKGNSGQYQVKNWTDIIAVSVGSSHTVGLKSNGTVVATPYIGNRKYYHGASDVSLWREIIAISAGGSHTVGLKKDGTVIATDYVESSEGPNRYYGQCEVWDWTDIVAISAGESHTVGLRSDGTVVAAGDNSNGACEVSDWENIVAISAADNFTAGLRSDGTVVVVGNRYTVRYHASDWTNIVDICLGHTHLVGLRSDGTVMAVPLDPRNEEGCDVYNWKDIVAVSAGTECTAGLRSDGTVVTAGSNCFQSIISTWKLFGSLKTIEHEQKHAAELREEQRREEAQKAEEMAREIAKKREKEQQRRSQGVCPYCGGTFKGLFKKVCSQCGKPKDY